MSKETPLQQTLLKLKSVFPEAVTETRREDDKGKPYYVYALKEEFIEQLRDEDLDIADDQNRYELQFPGKNTAKAQVYVPSYKTLVADEDQSKDFDNTGNLFIEGDNLDVLRMLQTSYRDKIKVIYIDPPYNTGGDDFVYNDDFSVKQKEYLQAVGVLDEDGVRQISELQNGLRGRFHAGWLAFMYPRLKLARELLTDDGVIFISIDDNEQANLKLLCDEIFGEDNLVGLFNWKTKNPARGVPPNTMLMSNHEYVVCFAKNYANFKLQGEERKLTDFRNPDNDSRGLWRSESMKATGSKNKPFTITNPNTELHFSGNWAFSEKRVKEMIKDNLILFPSTAGGTPRQKKFMDSYRNERKAIVTSLGWFSTENATKDFMTIFEGNKVFYFPKPIELIKFLIEQATDTEDIILDFFAGSATTAHAVMQLNAEDGGNRKFILVQWAEKINAKKSKEAHTFCKETLKRPANIAEIAKERIRRAGAKIFANNPDKQIDTGFRAFTVRDSLLTRDEQQPLAQTEQKELSLYKTELARANFEPLLYEVLLKTGITLDMPLTLHEVKGYPIAICNRRCYCITENLTQPIVQQIAEQHGDEFDILYYLSDCPKPTTSYTELESAIKIVSKDKQIEIISVY